MENEKNGIIKWFVSSIGLLIAIGIWVGMMQSTIFSQAEEIKELKGAGKEVEKSYQKEIKEINEKLGQIQISVAVIAQRIGQ